MFFSLYNNFTLLIILPGVVLSIWAQYKIRRAYGVYSKIPGGNGVSGSNFVSVMLRQNGIQDVQVLSVRGNLTDHFDPRKKTISLSENVYSSSSVAALAIAAHEAGHALQHAKNYVPIKIRGVLAPVVGAVSSLAFPLIMIGLMIRYTPLITIASYAFLAVFIFHLVTLPIELNASKRALENIEVSHVLTGDAFQGAKKVLFAAALTYVAAALTAFLQFLSLSMLSRRK